MYKLFIVLTVFSNLAFAGENRYIEHNLDSLIATDVNDSRRVVQSIPYKYRSLIDGWYAGSVDVEKVFKIASKSDDDWILNGWLKNAGEGSELYSIYLVLKTEEIKKRILNGLGAVRDYYLLESLGLKDRYVMEEFDRLFNSDDRGAVMVMDKVRMVKDAKRLIEAYNSGFVNYEKLVKKSTRNQYLSTILRDDVALLDKKNKDMALKVVFGPKITIIEE